MEDGAGPIVIRHRLLEADIHQHASIESVGIGLIDNVDSVMELLTPVEETYYDHNDDGVPEDGMEMSKEDHELGNSLSVRYDNGHLEMAQ